MEAALDHLVPNILHAEQSFSVHAHQGKSDLLGRLPNRLRGYRAWLPEAWAIIVVVDEDREDCEKLKGLLESFANKAGLKTRSRSKHEKPFHVINWLAIEELEAWFFGDVDALVAAYPGVPETLAKKAGFREPDAIKGGTWEALERVLQAAGHHAGGLEKIRAAREIAAQMDPSRNRSTSFRGFRDALRATLP